MSILDLGKFIKDLFKKLDINIYPIIAENSALLPFAVYERVSTQHNHKDQQVNEATYSITIISEQYTESINLLQKVIDACRKMHTYQDTNIRLDVESTTESYSVNYNQNITITITI